MFTPPVIPQFSGEGGEEEDESEEEEEAPTVTPLPPVTTPLLPPVTTPLLPPVTTPLLPTTTLLGGIEPETVDDYLDQGDNESEEHFTFRATLAENIMAKGGVEPGEAVMLARLIQNKYLLGVIYPPAIEEVIALTITKLQP